MKNKLINKKILFLIIFILIIIFFIPCICHAIDLSGLGDLNGYGKINRSSPNFESKVGIVIGVVQVVGSLISVVCLIALGVKYMTGSVEEKAEYKKTLMPYFLGSIMVFGISNLLQIVYQIAINLT